MLETTNTDKLVDFLVSQSPVILVSILGLLISALALGFGITVIYAIYLKRNGHK